MLHEFVAHARERFLLVNFAAYTLAELAANLKQAVERGCQVDVVFETEEDSAGAYSGRQSKPFGAVTGARRWRWPANQRPAGAALTATLEAGVLIEDHDLAAELEAHPHADQLALRSDARHQGRPHCL